MTEKAKKVGFVPGETWVGLVDIKSFPDENYQRVSSTIRFFPLSWLVQHLEFISGPELMSQKKVMDHVRSCEKEIRKGYYKEATELKAGKYDIGDYYDQDCFADVPNKVLGQQFYNLYMGGGEGDSQVDLILKWWDEEFKRAGFTEEELEI